MSEFDETSTIKCPQCGAEIIIAGPRKKGQGKKTGAEKIKLSENDVYALKVIERLGCISLETAQPMREIAAEIRAEAREKGWRIPSEHTVGFWASDLLGAGFLSMQNRQCKIVEFETKQIRFVTKPVWWLSQEYQDETLQAHDDGTIIRADTTSG